jgi:cytochrome b561
VPSNGRLRRLRCTTALGRERRFVDALESRPSLFYAILLVGPFLGWAAASAHSVPVKLLGILTLLSLASRKTPWGLEAGDIHGYAMWTSLALGGLHVAAALYHHFARHDDVLRRMLYDRSR